MSKFTEEIVSSVRSTHEVSQLRGLRTKSQSPPRLASQSNSVVHLCNLSASPSYCLLPMNQSRVKESSWRTCRAIRYTSRGGMQTANTAKNTHINYIVSAKCAHTWRRPRLVAFTTWPEASYRLSHARKRSKKERKKTRSIRSGLACNKESLSGIESISFFESSNRLLFIK
jgi:hypothetical protein